MTGYKQMTVVSGKGGTGKTSVLASFAALADGKVIADTDVDAANLHIMLHPTVLTTEEFWGAKIAVRDPEKCKQCGECERACRFDAITVDDINEYACEGCGLCTLVCPEKALVLEPALTGDLYVSETKYGPMAHARLVPGAESSGRLVTMVRQAAETIAIRDGLDTVIIDGPPGIGCTVTAAIADIDLALVVTEPTPSGIHDMARVLKTADYFGVSCAVIVNKADINEALSDETERVAAEHGARAIGRLPYDSVVTEAVSAMTPVVEFAPDSGVSKAITRCWSDLEQMLKSL